MKVKGLERESNERRLPDRKSVTAGVAIIGREDVSDLVGEDRHLEGKIQTGKRTDGGKPIVPFLNFDLFFSKGRAGS